MPPHVNSEILHNIYGADYFHSFGSGWTVHQEAGLGGTPLTPVFENLLVELTPL